MTMENTEIKAARLEEKWAFMATQITKLEESIDRVEKVLETLIALQEWNNLKYARKQFESYVYILSWVILGVFGVIAPDKLVKVLNALINTI